jgi:hypothetical protein
MSIVGLQKVLEQKKLKEGDVGEKVVDWAMKNLCNHEDQEDSLVVPCFERNHWFLFVLESN